MSPSSGALHAEPVQAGSVVSVVVLRVDRRLGAAGDPASSADAAADEADVAAVFRAVRRFGAGDSAAPVASAPSDASVDGEADASAAGFRVERRFGAAVAAVSPSDDFAVADLRTVRRFGAAVSATSLPASAPGPFAATTSIDSVSLDGAIPASEVGFWPT